MGTDSQQKSARELLLKKTYLALSLLTIGVLHISIAYSMLRSPIVPEKVGDEVNNTTGQMHTTNVTSNDKISIEEIEQRPHDPFTSNTNTQNTFSFALAPGCHDPSGILNHPGRTRTTGNDGTENFTIWCLGDISHAIVEDVTFDRFRTRKGVSGGADLIANLPRKSYNNPYVVFAQGLQLDKCSRLFNSQCKAWSNIFEERNDILYAMMDRGDARLCDDEAGKLPGISLVPGGNRHSLALPITDKAINETVVRKYLLFFAGTNHEGWFGSSLARPWLYRSSKDWIRTHGDVDDIIISERMDTEQYIDILLRTKFVLVPRGDGRWNRRLFEVIQTGAIPIFMADGLEPPFAPLINWNLASVHIPEEAALDFDALQKKIRSIPPNAVDTMGRNVRKIWEKCFENQKKRAYCLLQSVWILVQNKTFSKPPKLFAERMSVPLCPFPRRYDGDRGIVRYENKTFDTWQELH